MPMHGTPHAPRYRRGRTAIATLAALALLGGLLVATFASPAVAESIGPINFETGFSDGSPNGQFGWSATGSAGSGCATYDHAIVANVGAPASFGTKSLRMSNAVTSGCFGDQTFSQSLDDAAGESSAEGGTVSSSAIEPHFEAEWDFASTVPGAEQPGLSVVASPDRGDGARMSWIQMADSPTGLVVRFNDYRDEHTVGGILNDPNGCDTNDNFFQTEIASGLDRTVPHTIKVTMDFLDGPRNDIVRVWVDGTLKHTDTSWEDYFRYCEGNPTRTVDSILFRTGGTAVPATNGFGFLIDNLSLESGPIVTENSDGEWTLYPEQSSTSETTTTETTSYQAKVRPPINADGSSNFPKRRGVIPVQFDLESATRTVVETTTTTGPVKFESILSDNPGNTDNDYSVLRFVPDTSMKFADLDELVADYTFTQGNCGGGSLAWYIRMDVGNDGDPANDKNIFLNFGDVPNFTDCTTGANDLSGDNLIGTSDARFDATQLSGPYYGTYADMLALYGNVKVVRTTLVLDSGWFNGDQVVDLSGASADGNEWTPLPEGESTAVDSDTTTPFAKTCDLPEAHLKWTKNDPVPSGPVNEGISIQPGDDDGIYRHVDCKYIYNLDVGVFGDLSTRAGTYRVWVNIDGDNIDVPAKFDLR